MTTLRVALAVVALAAASAFAQEEGAEEPAQEAPAAPQAPAVAPRPLRPAGRPFNPGQRPVASQAPAAPAAENDAPVPTDSSISGGGQGVGGNGVQTGSADGSGAGGFGNFKPMSGGAGGGGTPAASSFKIVDLDKLPTTVASHARINLKGFKGLAVRFNTHDYRSRRFTFLTATFLGGQASDVVFKAAVSRTPGDISSTPPCRIKGVTQDGPGGTRARSEIMVAVDPGPAPAGGGTAREKQSRDAAERDVKSGAACPLEAGTEYFYNIIGDCDYESIAHQDSMGWDNKGPQNGCPIVLVDNGIQMLAPGNNGATSTASRASGPAYHGLTAAEEQQFQKWLASLPPNERTVYQAAGDGARYKWWSEFGAGKP